MDNHRPKSWLGLREFLKEYLIIVVGVLTALGAGQVAEAFHWRDEVAVEREALRSEVRANVTAAAYRRSEQTCIDARLAQVAEVFRRHARGEALGLKTRVARPPVWIASAASWDIAVSGQALGHMPQEQKFAFSNAFHTFNNFGRLRNEEDAVWRKLALLDHPDLLDATDWSRLHEAWGDALGISDRLRSVTDDIVGPGSLGERPTKVPDEEVTLRDAFCAPLIG